VLIQKSHLVAGSLGTFGFIHGSNLASKAEELAHKGNSDNYLEAEQELVKYIDKALYEIDC
jgi:HPt (histidine-containing phosphotransfer) domain-containing protein